MVFREQPLDLKYAPPRYPSHGYEGVGQIVRVFVGETVVGHLTTTGVPPETVGWDAAPPADTPEGIVSDIVSDLLREGARAGRPLPDVYEEILRTVEHDWPVAGNLADLRGDAEG